MRIALALGLSLIACGALAAPHVKGNAKIKAPDLIQAKSSPQDSYRWRLNENVVTIMAGRPDGTELNIAADIAAVLDDGDNLRVLPMVGKGAAQTVKDVMFLRGVDMGLTQANVLRHFAKTGELGSNFVDQITYVAKLFNQEIHIVARPGITDLKQLNGQAVNFGEEGSGTDITAQLIFEAFGISVQPVHLPTADAILKLKSGEIAGAIVLGSKPSPALAALKDAGGLKLLPIPYTKALEDDYYPATLSHADYPELIADGKSVDTVAVCTVLVAFNWPSDSIRYQKLSKFVGAFFDKFDQFQQPPRHPKWREVNFAATLEGWHRSPLSQAWIDHAKETDQTAANDTTDVAARGTFDAFLAQNTQASAAPTTDAERASLFKAFLEWRKDHGN
jgi:TRAP transporter TAXI family solute receptor